jgi:signal transduction histidine kinase/HAMP domain-containing protein
VTVAIPLHLGVHVLGLAVAAGLTAIALMERRDHPGRPGVAVGGLLLLASHLVTGALLAEAGEWPLLLRTAGYTALAVGAAGRLAGGAAVVVAVPPLAHVAAALAGLAAGVATARGVLGRGRGVAALAAGVVLWAAADLFVGTRPGLSAGLSVTGSVAVGSWVLARAGAASLAGRFVGAATAVLVLLTVGLGAASGVLYTTDLRAEQAERLEAVALARATEIGDGWPRELETTASLLSGAALVADVEDAQQPGDLDGRAASIVALPGIDLALVIDADGGPLGSARGGDGLAGADAATLAGDPTSEVALAGDTARGLVTLGDGQLVAVGTTPVAPADEEGNPERDRTMGVLLVGRVLTADAVIEDIAADTGADAAMLVDGRPVSSTLPTAAGSDLAAVRSHGATEVAGQERTVATAPLVSPGGAELASLVLALPAGAAADLAESATRSTFLVATLGLMVASGLAIAVSRRVTDPVRRLTDAAERVAGGDLSARVAVDRTDEVGRLAGAFDGMTVALAAREADLREAAVTQTSLRERLEAVTAAMGEALLAVDGRGRLTLANPAATELLAIGDVPTEGLLVDTLLRGTADAGVPLLEAIGPAGSSRSASARGLLPDGRVVAATAAPLLDEDGGLGRVYVLRDVTSEVAADRLRTEIVANVSHELRTPLTPIVGYLELLRGRELPAARVRDFAEQGAQAAERLQKIIEKFIDLADLEAGNTPVEIEEVAVGTLVAEAVERWTPQLDGKRLQRHVRRGLPDVAVDPRLVGRVLDELIENAAKFSEGPVRLLGDVDVEGVVCLTVRDQGPGIDADEIERVLADFEQADGSATRSVGGLGLGLSIVQRMLARLDAELDLAPSPHGGTDATLRLRAVR